jgi:hypothetical protein
MFPIDIAAWVGVDKNLVQSWLEVRCRPLNFLVANCGFVTRHFGYQAILQKAQAQTIMAFFA